MLCIHKNFSFSSSWASRKTTLFRVGLVTSYAQGPISRCDVWSSKAKTEKSKKMWVLCISSFFLWLPVWCRWFKLCRWFRYCSCRIPATVQAPVPLPWRELTESLQWVFMNKDWIFCLWNWRIYLLLTWNTYVFPFLGKEMVFPCKDFADHLLLYGRPCRQVSEHIMHFHPSMLILVCHLSLGLRP